MRTQTPARVDGIAIVYCEGAFGTTYGKTAHGLVRLTHRYEIAAVIDSELAGHDAGHVLDGKDNGIPVVADLTAARCVAEQQDRRATHFVIGIAPDGGVLGGGARAAVLEAIEAGLGVDSGLHHRLADDVEVAAAAFTNGVQIRDVRRPPPLHQLHMFSGKIRDVDSAVVAVLGTDSAVGKRTTAWSLVGALRTAGISAELVGTGQTAWLQGVRYGIILDSLVNDFVAGEIEHAVWSAWSAERPDVIVVEGQGSLMHPAYPGGFEILAAARPAAVILQHAPARRTYDGFEDFPLHPIEQQVDAIRVLSRVPVVAVTINSSGLSASDLARERTQIRAATGVIAIEPLRDGCAALVDALAARG